MSTVNVPRQSSKDGIISGTESFEVMGRRKTGRFDMPVAQGEDEQVESQPYFVVLIMASSHIFYERKSKSGLSVSYFIYRRIQISTPLGVHQD